MSHKVTEDGWSPQGPVVELSDTASWDLLGSRSFGRLAVSDHNRPEIFPVNYYSDGRTILFRTAEGEKLHTLTHNMQVAFEVDAESEGSIWSVVVKGRAMVIDLEPVLSNRVLDAFPPWVPTQPFVYVVISPDSIRGRVFEHRLPIGHLS
ncbi:pyridoxamine 5'-phosphate oxidase family protein [Salinibacterium sp.]|uniref:pyridoxamine 5'-phosphate oxidase family protein n=1 Tax=Salinibacterium sp. TaxID=1915057 RepID=UPI00286D3A36|nr:pyridoxamine 5'-phosphate oxidase family protein [Salinibacterium sp.]